VTAPNEPRQTTEEWLATLTPARRRLHELHSSIDASLYKLWGEVEEFIRSIPDLPEELPADHLELYTLNSELHLAISYWCFLSVATRDLSDGGLSECEFTYASFIEEDYPTLRAPEEQAA
jgi:hypothetical protein